MSKNVEFGAGEGKDKNQCSTNIHGIFSEFYFLFIYTQSLCFTDLHIGNLGFEKTTQNTTAATR
jgi:hypothetical protein